jgi:serine/threonine protein kinase
MTVIELVARPYEVRFLSISEVTCEARLVGDPQHIRPIALDVSSWFGEIHPRLVPIWDAEVRAPQELLDKHQCELVVTVPRAGLVSEDTVFEIAEGIGDPAKRATWIVPQMIEIAEAVAAMAARRPGFVHERLIPRSLGVQNGVILLRSPILGLYVGRDRYPEDRFDKGARTWRSPEQHRSDNVTPRSDVFQLAALTYAAITGNRPYDDDHVISGPPPPGILELPEPLQLLLIKNLSREPEERASSPAAFAETLRVCWSNVRESLPRNIFAPFSPPRFERPSPPAPPQEEPLGETTHEQHLRDGVGPLQLTRTVFAGKTVFAFSGDPNQLDEITAGTRRWLGFRHARVLPVLDVEERQAEDQTRLLVITAANDHRITMSDYARKQWPGPSTERTSWAVHQILAIADALGAMAAVAPGLVHRRISAETLVVDDEANVVLCPPVESYTIGKYRFFGYGAKDHRLWWLSPEQIRGKDCSPASDVFELAMLLYLGITGIHPFIPSIGKYEEPTSFGGMEAIIGGPAPAPLPVTKELNALILRNLSRDPTQRDASPPVFAASLRSVW